MEPMVRVDGPWHLVRDSSEGRVVLDNSVRSTYGEAERLRDAEFRRTAIGPWEIERTD